MKMPLFKGVIGHLCYFTLKWGFDFYVYLTLKSSTKFQNHFLSSNWLVVSLNDGIAENISKKPVTDILTDVSIRLSWLVVIINIRFLEKYRQILWDWYINTVYQYVSGQKIHIMFYIEKCLWIFFHAWRSTTFQKCTR